MLTSWAWRTKTSRSSANDANSKGELMELFKNWAAISSLAGLLLYAIGRLFTDVFYGNYGLTPEDLGINVPYLVMRILPLAAILGGLVMAIGLVAAFFSGMGAKPLADAVQALELEKEPNKLEAIQRTIRGLGWRIKAAFLAMIVIVVSAYIAFEVLQVPTELDYFRPEARAGLFPTIWLGLGVGLMLGAYWGGREGFFEASEEGSPEEGSPEASEEELPVDYLFVVRLCIAFLGLAFAIAGLANLGKLPFTTADLYAKEVDKGNEVELTLGGIWPVFRVDSFRVTSVGAVKAPIDEKCILLLGASGSTTFVYDSEDHRAWRIPSASIGLSRNRAGGCPPPAPSTNQPAPPVRSP